MNNDQILGWTILVLSLAGAVIYFWLLFLSPWHILVIQVSAFIAVTAMLLILAWIGYTLATTPPPMPLEDIDLDLDEDFDIDDTEIESDETEEENPESE
jgi:predicted DNA-binding transcriptional regulator